MPRRLQVKRVTTSARGAGWLQSRESSKIGRVVARSYNVNEKLRGQASTDRSTEVVRYKGTALLMKKLKMDGVADDTVSEDVLLLLREKKVVMTVQLTSNEIDPPAAAAGEALLSSEVSIEGLVSIFEPSTAENQLSSFDLEFAVPKTFGAPGVILVRSNSPIELLLLSFTLELPDKSCKALHYITNSWVYSTQNSEPRIFFRNKAYLPKNTPEALKELREKELQELQGDGTGERKESDRIYDYATYNDLGKPDEDPKLARPRLGGSAEFPFPRRMRTGRPPSKTSPETECRTPGVQSFYVPSDERFDYIKSSDNKANAARANGHAVEAASKIMAAKDESDNKSSSSFQSIEQVKQLLYASSSSSSSSSPPAKHKHDIGAPGSTNVSGEKNNQLLFPLPQILQVDDKAWQTNEEFAREYLAGFNPIQIELVKEFPIKSSLSPAEYGDPTSAISEKHIAGHLEGLSIEQAVSGKKLFVVDYHDVFLPWVGRINAQAENRKQYASRSLFFLSSDCTLKVLAIELTLPPSPAGGGKISRVFTPAASSSAAPHSSSSSSSSSKKPDYLFELAKAHATNNDMTMQQSINHVARCHAVAEVAIIASNRQLSKLHPIYQLMAPHFRYTLQVNSGARFDLLSAGGAIEQIYTPGEYVFAMASAYYRDYWTFESNALPNDLIKRGMAEPDSNAKHGIKLVVKDYPYAVDGLEVWDAMKTWNTDYIDIFYNDDSEIQKDTELQAWYEEYRSVGHGDKKQDVAAPGGSWPELNSKTNLAFVLTTMQWIATAMHAPINYGLYDYAGFMPYRPAITRRLIPDHGTQEWEEFQGDPEKFFLSAISDTDTTTTAMSVFEQVSAHAPNEEYIDERSPFWSDDEKAQAAFKRYCDKLKDIDQLIQARNADKNLKNRCGVAQLPFELLRPHSTPGVTAMGIPNSITA
ncbi:unnamed protein product [Sphagnum jensenii]|uniref:Lipoxygenase n=1 Tax=Sphagnum jensenii TaxID=128206 RepID=A0ABP0WVT6_9BRYO